MKEGFVQQPEPEGNAPCGGAKTPGEEAARKTDQMLELRCGEPGLPGATVVGRGVARKDPPWGTRTEPVPACAPPASRTSTFVRGLLPLSLQACPRLGRTGQTRRVLGREGQCPGSVETKIVSAEKQTTPGSSPLSAGACGE